MILTYSGAASGSKTFTSPSDALLLTVAGTYTITVDTDATFTFKGAAGGGGGGTGSSAAGALLGGGGGGGGAVTTGTTISLLAARTYTLVVGAGGAQGAPGGTGVTTKLSDDLAVTFVELAGGHGGTGGEAGGGSGGAGGSLVTGTNGVSGTAGGTHSTAGTNNATGAGGGGGGGTGGAGAAGGSGSAVAGGAGGSVGVDGTSKSGLHGNATGTSGGAGGAGGYATGISGESANGYGGGGGGGGSETTSGGGAAGGAGGPGVAGFIFVTTNGLPPGSIVISGTTPTLRTAVPVAIGTLAITGIAPALRFAAFVAAGSIAFTGYAPIITNSRTAAPGAGAVTLTGLAPSVRISVGIPAGSLAFTGLTPGLNDQDAVPVGSIALTGYAPTIINGVFVTATAVWYPSDRTTGGETITIIGSGFTVGTTVTIDGISCPVTFISATRITTVTPAHAAGAVSLIVSNGGAYTSTLVFTYYAVAADPTSLVTDFGGATPLILDGQVSSQQTASQGSTQFEIVPAGSRPIPFTPAKFGVGSLADRDLIMRGEVQVSKTVHKAETNIGWTGVVADSNAQFNRNLVWGSYTSIDAGLIALDLLSKFAPEFTGVNIASGLGPTSIVFQGVTMDTAMQALATDRGGYYYRDEAYDVHLFITEAPPLVPDPIDSSNTSLIVGTFSWTADTKQMRNRVTGIGASTSVIAAAAPGDALLIVQNSAQFANATNTVLIGVQRITYAGTSTETPTTPTTGASAIPGGLSATVYYKYSYTIGGVQTALSPASAAFSGGFLLPLFTVSANPISAGPAGGGMVNGASYHYCFSYYSSAGEGVNGNSSADAFTAGVNGSAAIGSGGGTLTPSGIPGVGIRIWRTKAGGSGASAHYLAGSTPADGVTNTFIDMVADVNLGIPMGTGSFIGPPVGLAYKSSTVTVANGPTGTTAKNLYRTKNGAASSSDPYYSIGSIPDNATMTFVDSAADSSLTNLAPTASSVGFLTGIPSSGVGSITAAINIGDPIALYSQRNDLTSQALVRAIENTAGHTKSTGIYEAKLSSSTIAATQAALDAACDADLVSYASSGGVITANGTSYDSKIHYGRTLHIAKDGLLGDFLIQSVNITKIGFAPNTPPRYTWTASSIRFSFEDLLRKLVANLGAA